MATAGGIEIPITLGGVKDVRNQIKQLRGELINATDPAEVARLSENIGGLADKLKDANEKAQIFASDSKFEQTSNAFGLMKSQIASLDFQGAGESAALFANRVKSINPAEFGTQVKGLISVVGNLSKAFISMGASLLANPIFIMVIAITAIVAVVVALMSKLGVLKPVLAAIGKVFEYIENMINEVVQAIQDFLDWLGLTNFAEQKAAQVAADSQKKKADAYDATAKKATTSLDQQIRLMQLEGKDTVKLELLKQYYIQKTAEERIKALKSEYKAKALSGDLSKEEIKRLNDEYAAAKDALKTSKNEAQYIRKKDRIERENSEKEASKKSFENAKDEGKKRIDAQKKYNDDRKAVEREAQDLTISLMKDGEEKEREVIKEKYLRAIEDIKINEKYLESERTKIISLLKQEQTNELNAIESAKQAEKIEVERARQAELAQIQFDAKKELIEILEQAENLQAEKDLTKNQIAENLIREKYFTQIELAKQYGLDATALEQQQQDEIDAIRKASADAEIERQNKLNAQRVDAVKGGLTAIGNVAELWAGRDIERQKKAFKVQKLANIASATIDTYKGATSAFASAGNPILGAIFAAAVVSAGLLNIQKIKSTEFGGGGASPSGGGGANVNTPSASVAPAFSFQGGGNNANSLNAQNDFSSMNIKAYVSESEITGTQNKVNKYKNNSEL